MRLRLGPCATVTQATSKATGVTCEGVGGQITMHNANLATLTSVAFVVTNSYVGVNDTVVVSIGSGATTLGYLVGVEAVSAGSFKVQLRNNSAGTLGEAVVLNFSVIKNNI